MNLGVDQWALVVSVATLLLALLVVPAVRRPAKVAHVKLARLVGTDLRRYRSWFENQHGKLQNVYLDRTETLSLHDTYVPLAGYRGNEPERVSAAEVLHSPDATRMIVLGDPGSGKSTLLRAFGTSMVSGTRPKSDASFEGSLRHIPVLVSLRAFARYLESGRTPEGSLRVYIEQEILQRTARVRQGARLLAGLLDDHRLLLLLDGLDEVPDALVQDVRTEVLRFVDMHMRVVLTCRRQNFLAVRTDWIPILTDRTYTLAPLRDDEVLAFIHRRQKDFKPPKTPSDLFQSITQSGTLELHRVPLILTVSIGLYIQLTGYRIPTSLASFYDEMIKQLLTRHDFRLEHAGTVNVFSADDKQRFLREFSYQTATRSGRLEDFSLTQLVKFAEELTDRLTSVRRGEGERLVEEIINRSGLIAQASLEEEYAFAHRSIQEYLIANRLLGDPKAGAEFLLMMADETEWRLVAIFFASFEHNYVEYFLSKLRSRNLELCGHCMANALIADRVLVADTVAALRDRVIQAPTSADRGPAFAAITMLANASQPWIRDEAVRALLACLETTPAAGVDAVSDFLGLDQDAIARVLSGLAGVTNERVFETAARLATLPAAGNLRNVRPLWYVYWEELAKPSAMGAGHSVIARRLVQLSSTVEGLRELQAQPPPRMVHEEISSIAALAYPFTNGVAQDSNLAILLASIMALKLDVSDTNMLAEAASASDPNLATLERDYHRRTKRVYLFWPARITALVAYLAYILLVVTAVVSSGWGSLLFNARTIALDNLYYLLPGALATLVALVGAYGSAERSEPASGRNRGLLRLPWSGAKLRMIDNQHFQMRRDPDPSQWREHSGGLIRTANPAVGWIDRLSDAIYDNGYVRVEDFTSAAFTVIVSVVTLPLTLGVRLVVGSEPILVIVGATSLILVAFWLPATYLCARGVPIDVRRRNPLMGAYSDPACAHWLRSATAGA